MKKYFYNDLSDEEIAKLVIRPSINFTERYEIVKHILDKIKYNGMNAVLEFANKYDGLGRQKIKIDFCDIVNSGEKLGLKVRDAIQQAYNNISKFHFEQKPVDYKIETMPGVFCSREYRAIESVGLYIPGGSAPLPSTMLMLGVPAQIAGCEKVIACSPTINGSIHPAILYAANLCGISEIYAIGGAQAIALMAFGAEGIAKVNKIFGPGNQYVTLAKQLVSIDAIGCAIDMPAGPSEVLLIADETAFPEFIAADILSQTEHGADSQVVLVTASEAIADLVEIEIEAQLKNLPRKIIANEALSSSLIIIVDNIDAAFEFSNRYAPEHLILQIAEAEKYIDKVKNAGSVFLGMFSPESVGDYASGTNHSLPTYGYAKAYSGLGVENFMKSITFQKLTKAGLKNIGSTVMTLAETETLTAHKNAVEIRLNKYD